MDPVSSPTRLSPADGPLATALADIAAGQDGVEAARRELRSRQAALVAVLRDQLRTVGEVRAEVVSELYWHHPQVRVTDLADGLGVSPAELRRIAGPLPVETECGDCGTTVAWLRTSRSDDRRPLCEHCQQRMSEPSWQTGGIDGDPNGGSAWTALFVEVESLLTEHGCDHSLRLTMEAARKVGLDPTSVRRTVMLRDGYCDCEVLLNVADRRWF